MRAATMPNMTPPQSLAEMQASIKMLREKLARGHYSGVEATAYLCLIFYYYMTLIMSEKSVPEHRKVANILENFRTSAAVMGEYLHVKKDQAQTEQFGRIIAFGMVQCLSQLVDASEHIYKAVGMDADTKFREIKRKEFWKFRTRHTHISTRPSARPTAEGAALDTHVFMVENTNALQLTYSSIGEPGYMRQTVHIEDLFNDLQSEIHSVFGEITSHCKLVGIESTVVEVRTPNDPPS